MYYSIGKKVGVFIDSQYEDKWGNFKLNDVAEIITNECYEQTNVKLSIYYEKNPMTKNTDEAAMKFYDANLSVAIIKNSDTDFSIFASYECPEWFNVMLEVMMLKAGLTFVHAAALEKNGSSVLLPARGGVGKTATAMKLIKQHGWRLLGDDLVILNEAPNLIIGYHRPFVIYGYHKNIFPEFFSEGKGPVKNSFVSDIMTTTIPMMKKILRTVPAVLSFARTHNPHSKRVRPADLFSENQLANCAEHINKTIWIDRTSTDSVSFSACSFEEISARCAAVTLTELTAGGTNLNNSLIEMCNSGMLNYKEIYNRIFDIIASVISNADTYVLSIPKHIPIEDVADIVYEYIESVK